MLANGKSRKIVLSTRADLHVHVDLKKAFQTFQAI